MKRTKIIIFLTLVIVFTSCKGLPNENSNSNFQLTLYNEGFYNKCVLEDFTLYNQLKLKNLDVIIDDIEKTLSLEYKNEITFNYKNNCYDSLEISLDSLFFLDSSNSDELCYYSIYKRFYWYSFFITDSSIARELSGLTDLPLVIFNTNKLKACYWLWQIYTDEYNARDLGTYKKVGNEYSLCEFKAKNIFDTLYYPNNFKRNIKGDSIKYIQKKSVLIRNQYAMEHFDKIFVHCQNWLKLYRKYGLEEMRNRKLSPVPEGYEWVKIWAVIKN